VSGIDTSVVSQLTDSAQNICRAASTVVEALFAGDGAKVDVVVVDGKTVPATAANLPESNQTLPVSLNANEMLL